jgi:hypothetical protein
MANVVCCRGGAVRGEQQVVVARVFARGYEGGEEDEDKVFGEGGCEGEEARER